MVLSSKKRIWGSRARTELSLRLYARRQCLVSEYYFEA